MLILSSSAKAGVSIAFDSTQDYLTMKGEDASRGVDATLASKWSPGFQAQLAFSFNPKWGLRLRYKFQKADFNEPSNISVANDSQNLEGYSVEIPHQHNVYFQSFLRLRKQDRLLFDFSDANQNLEIYRLNSTEVGYGFIFETENRPGLRAGIGAWASLLSMKAEDKNTAPVDPEPGYEFGANIRLGLLTTQGLGYFLRGQYTTANVEAGSFKFLLRDMSITAGMVFQFGD